MCTGCGHVGFPPHPAPVSWYTARELEAVELQPPVHENPQPRLHNQPRALMTQRWRRDCGRAVPDDCEQRGATIADDAELRSRTYCVEQPDQAQEMAVVPFDSEVKSAWRQARKELRPEPDAEGLRRSKRVPKPYPEYTVDLLISA
jgi:hypothetical protein